MTNYATPAEYRDRTGASASVADQLLTDELESASRLIDQDLRIVPNYFTPTTDTYIFATDGGTVLRFRDEAGLAHCLREVVADGIRPDYDLSGVYDQEAWDLDDVWVWPQPRSAAKYDHPYFSLELRQLGDIPYGVWPTGGGSVSIEGEWGWPAIPPPLREMTIYVARQMRDSMRGGAAQRVEVVDDLVSFRDDGWRLWQTIKRRYGRIPVRAGRRR